jgi:hypothetical protein
VLLKVPNDAELTEQWTKTETTLLDREKLLKAIDDDLQVCREAGQLHAGDEKAKERNILEFNTLMTHLRWAESVADQNGLERIVESLDTNPFLRGYQRWRERSQAG